MEPGIQGIRAAFEQDERFRKGLQRVHGEQYEATFYNWFNGWHQPASLEWNMRPLLAQIRCPAWIVQGELDEHATPQHARDIAAGIHSSQLWLVPDGKHMLPQEMPTIFNPRFLAFLDQIKSQKTPDKLEV